MSGLRLDAMILAAGRGERMRPLTDRIPKPLVGVRGAPLIEHHIRKLAAIGATRIVINVSYLADQLIEALGTGERFGCELIYSVEPEPLESGGGVATASPHFRGGAVILVSADIYSEYDYARLDAPARAIAAGSDGSGQPGPCAHFVMVKARPGEPGGEFSLEPARQSEGKPPGTSGLVGLGQPRHTLANVAVLATAPCRQWPRSQRFKLLPHYQEWVERGAVTGELHNGLWRNVTTPTDVEALNA